MNTLKRVLTGTLALAMSASMLAACGGDDSSASSTTGGNNSTGTNDSTASGDKTVIKVYTFTDETQGMINDYLAANPDVAAKYDFQVTLEAKAADYIQKVSAALAGDDAPDLFVADADYAQLFAGLEGTATLAELGVDFDENDYYAYMLDFTTVDGNRMAISHQAAPGAVLYRTDYAEQYLGVKTPEEMQEKLSDWDKFKAVADELKKNDIAMVSGIDEVKRCFMANRNTAWVDADMNYQIDEALIKQYLEVTKYLADNEEVAYAQNTQWNPEWYEGMKEGVFCYFGCTWYLHYTIKPNCLATLSGKDADGNATATDADYVDGNGSFGKWGMIQGPMPYFWGGTWWYGSDKAAADPAKKEAVAGVIEYYTCNAETMTAYAKKSGDFVSKKSVVDAIKSDEAFKNPFLGGQNHYEFFAQAAASVNAKTMSKYDDTFNTAVNDATTKYVLEGASMDDAIAYIKEYAMSNIEGLK